MKPSRDEAAWSSNILDEMEKGLENTNKKPFNLSPSDAIYEAVTNLVPWDNQQDASGMVSCSKKMATRCAIYSLRSSSEDNFRTVGH